MSKSKAAPFIVFLFALFAAGCPGTFSGNEDGERKPDQPVGPSKVEAVTASNIVGNWTRSSTTMKTSGSATIKSVDEEIHVINQDGSFRYREVYSEYENDSLQQRSFEETKGALEILADGMVREIVTAERRSNNADFADDQSGWVDAVPSTYSEYPLVIVDGNMHNYIMRRAGSFSGIIGSWEYKTFSSGKGPSSYSKTVYTFRSDMNVIGASYESSTPLYPSVPKRTYEAKYSSDGGYGIYRIDPEGGKSGYLKMVGDYILLGRSRDDYMSFKKF